jgi:hypothetical protein
LVSLDPADCAGQRQATDADDERRGRGGDAGERRSLFVWLGHAAR